MKSKNIDTETVNDLVLDANAREIVGLKESTWGASDEQIKNNDIYPMWDVLDNKLHRLQWSLFFYTLDNIKSDLTVTNADNNAIWDNKARLIDADGDNSPKNNAIYVLLHQIMNSDQFWWSSNTVLANDVHLYHKGMIDTSLALYSELSSYIDDKSVSEALNKKISEIKDEIVS